jgi:hypothetical protein
MLLRHVYRISLEDPLRWPMWFGLPVRESLFESFTIDLAMSYLEGLMSAAHEIAPAADDLTPFFTWLRDERHAFPTQGWCAQYLDEANGDHFAALQKLFGYIDEYVLLTMPAWFLELNRSPLPSQIKNGFGMPLKSDIRKPEHVELADRV